MHIASKSFAVGGPALPRTFALASLLLAAAACGGGSSGGGTGGSSSSGTTGPSAAQACADSAHASCTKRDACTDNLGNERTYGDEATCETQTAAPCVAALGAKGTGQTPAKIEACVAQYPSYACTDFFDNDPPAACAIPTGTLAMGSACGASAQCASSFCAISQYQVCGTCQPTPTVGATCQVNADCGRNLACATPTGATTGTCAAFVPSGGACLTGYNPCEAGLACVGDDETAKTMGTCKTQGTKMGDACDGSRKTAAGCNNDLGLVCIPTMKGSAVGTCQPAQLAAAGAACGDVGAMPITGFIECKAGGACIKATGATMGTCKAPAANGMPCDNDTTKGPPCLAPAKCVPTSSTVTSGTCTMPDASKCM